MKKVLSVLLCAALLGGIAGCSEIGSSEPPAERSETADGGTSRLIFDPENTTLESA